MSSTGLFIGHDKRIDSKPHNITPIAIKQQVMSHIDSFPKIESHYCRRDSKKEYLSPELNISIMYRLYQEYCEENDMSPVSRFVYQSIFHEHDPPLSFYKPKKDQCTVCNVFKASQNKEPSRANFENHKRREKESLEMKGNDKKRAVENKGREFRAISFDLQAILPIPFAGDSQVYYKSHLNVYNFTIYDCSNKDGICYVWDETHGSKGSSEIGTCLYKYLQSLPQTVEHVATFSDTCGGQNRNKFVSAAMLYSVSKLTNLKTIDLKFMESGHSYLEADSMHATIERARRHTKNYTTREWCLLISASRLRPRPYHVNNMQYCDFLDLQQLVECIVNNTSLNNNGEKVSWIRIKWLRFEKRSPNIIQYKYDLSADFFYEIDVSANKRRSGRKRSWDSVQLKRKYATRLPISEKKKSDLLYLLNHETIPMDYADFINNLPSTSDLSKLMLHSQSEDDQ
ncbi:unnamed protein product [Acanthoscelides obtectus]|uniref:DUF7869 domain-containing protein n=1 Tax=Acanthoscelides obtectus TaxID=200917 RepID=A0A9P0Q4C0_ACAOB|nr:unnamed protein product [Acanthoscelides obtectus]CAK1677000.1 hypothetical protein AOBTE_LOCUS31056 [Acanthoscelides obtectus]